MMKGKCHMLGSMAAVLLLLLFHITEADAGAVGEQEESSRLKAGYLVEFVDADDYETKIFNSQRGTVKEGETVEVSFPEQIVGSDGYLWSSLSESPQFFTVEQAGIHKYYIEYRKGEAVLKPELPEDEGKERLEQWLEKAWAADCIISGQSQDNLRDPYLIVENKTQNDSRIKNLVSMLQDAEWHYFYMVGRNYIPEAMSIGTSFDAVYSSTEEDSFKAGGQRYRVYRIGVKRNWSPESCSHAWELFGSVQNDCLKIGEESWRCLKCRKEETVFSPALGHLDQDEDSLCDRCLRRVFAQGPESRIVSELHTKSGLYTLSFTCIDSDYNGTGNMLYLADQVLTEDITGKVFEEADYNSSPIRNYLNLGLANDSSLASALQPIGREDGDGLADFAVLLSLEEQEFYAAHGRITPVERGYYLRTAVSERDDLMYAVSPDGAVKGMEPSGDGFGVRPAVLLPPPETGEMPERKRWQKGEIQMRRIGEQNYRFRCIDEDYRDQQDGHRKAALFLCDSVIRSDIDSDSISTRKFCFGEDNNYKTSNIRRWLAKNSSASGSGLEPFSIGVSTAYTGNTQEGTQEQLTESLLIPHEIGFQLIQDPLFSLSLEEALRYREELWRFGLEENNPESQISAWSQGYYLRTPFYAQDDSGRFCYSEHIYAVDLIKGNIHTVNTGSETYGIRPAFALFQE